MFEDCEGGPKNKTILNTPQQLQLALAPTFFSEDTKHCIYIIPTQKPLQTQKYLNIEQTYIMKRVYS